jgi:hypothetical protein
MALKRDFAAQDRLPICPAEYSTNPHILLRSTQQKTELKRLKNKEKTIDLLQK